MQLNNAVFYLADFNFPVKPAGGGRQLGLVCDLPGPGLKKVRYFLGRRRLLPAGVQKVGNPDAITLQWYTKLPI